MPMHFDGTITAGSLISAAIILIVGIAGWVAFRARVQVILDNQQVILDKLTERFEKHEDTDRELFKGMQDAITRLVADVSRLIGRYESAPMRRVADK